MDAIMVKRSSSGTYEIPGAATVEDWDEVKRECDNVRKLSDLTGWGQWSECYEVEYVGGTGYYFIGDAS